MNPLKWQSTAFFLRTRKTSPRQQPATLTAGRSLALHPASNPWLIIAGICLVGLGLRLLALPFSDTTEGDAFARGIHAWDLLKHPHLIIHGVWLPLQTYYMAGILGITQEFYYTPVLTNILLSVLTVIPLYWFSRREFGPNAGWFVALAFALYPLAFRNSLMGLSDTPFAFLTALALALLSYARGHDGRLWQAVLAGLMMTLAAETRYEAWLLIPLLGVALWRKPKFLICFWSLAMVAPGFWMLGSWLMDGHPLHSLTYQAADTAQTLIDRGGMSWRKRLVRLIFMPGILLFGLSALMFGLACLGAIMAVRHRRPQRIWLLPFLGVGLVLVQKSVAGTMNLQPRYGLILGMFLLPFAALALEGITNPRRRSLLTWGTLLLMLPSSYALNLVTPVLGSLLADTKMIKKESPASLINAVPRLNASTKTLSNIVNATIQGDDALAVICFPDITGLIAYASGVNPDRLYFSLTSHFDDYSKRYQLYLFFEQHPQGVITLDPDHWPTAVLSLPVGSRSELGTYGSLALRLIHDGDGGLVYRYQLLPNQPLAIRPTTF